MRPQPHFVSENGDPVHPNDLLGGAYQGPPLAMDADGVTPVTQMTMAPVMGPGGEQETEEIPSTDVATDLWSMFETILDYDAEDFDDIRYAGSKRVKSYDWIGDTFGTAVE